MFAVDIETHLLTFVTNATSYSGMCTLVLFSLKPFIQLAAKRSQRTSQSGMTSCVLL